MAAVAGFLAGSGANIISSDQHSTDPEGGEFFMRMEFNLEHGDLSSLGRAFEQEVAERLDMRWRLTDAGRPKRMAVLVSKEDHCLVDLCGATAAATSKPRSRWWPPTTRTTSPT